jgi:hypothetical protein
MAEEGRIDPIIGRDKEKEFHKFFQEERKIIQFLLEKQVVSLQSQKDLHLGFPKES